MDTVRSPLQEKQFTIRRPSSCTRRCSFRVAPIDENSSLLPPVGVWAVLNPSVADHPLRPATDRRLGGPLPRQLANPISATPIVRGLATPAFLRRAYAVLARVSPGCPPLQGRFLRVTHPSATDSRSCPCDLHVLSMPPAFALSQDQTLRFISESNFRRHRTH